MSSELENAEESLSAACRVRYELERNISRLKDEVREKYQALIDAECNAIDSRNSLELNKAVARERECERARDALNVESMRSATVKGIPVGGRVVQWKSRYAFSLDMVKTGIFGVIELCTSDSKFSDSRSDRPSIGSLFVRVLKKDGSCSLRFDKCFRMAGIRKD